MKPKLGQLATAVAALLLLGACTGNYRVDDDGVVVNPRPMRVEIGPDHIELDEERHHRHRREDDDDDDHEWRDGREYQKIHVPPGHYPPRGYCRIWYPGRPPGHQPPIGRCNVRVPKGAVLLRG